MSEHEEKVMTVEGNIESYTKGDRTVRIHRSPEHAKIKKRIRDCRMTFTATDKELEQIRAQMEKVGFTNFSAFCRKMLLNGLVVNVKIPGFEDAYQVMYEEGHVINMATKRINSAKVIDVKDIEIIKESIAKIKKSLQDVVDNLEVESNPLE